MSTIFWPTSTMRLDLTSCHIGVAVATEYCKARSDSIWVRPVLAVAITGCCIGLFCALNRIRNWSLAKEIAAGKVVQRTYKECVVFGGITGLGSACIIDQAREHSWKDSQNDAILGNIHRWNALKHAIRRDRAQALSPDTVVFTPRDPLGMMALTPFRFTSRRSFEPVNQQDVEVKIPESTAPSIAHVYYWSRHQYFHHPVDPVAYSTMERQLTEARWRGQTDPDMQGVIVDMQKDFAPMRLRAEKAQVAASEAATIATAGTPAQVVAAAGEAPFKDDAEKMRLWAAAEDQILFDANVAKFRAGDLAEALRATGRGPLICRGPDPIWHQAEDGSGENRYGKLLEQVRAHLFPLSAQ